MENKEELERMMIEGGLCSMKQATQELEETIRISRCLLTGTHLIDAALNESTLDYSEDKEVKEFMAWWGFECKDQAEKLRQAFDQYREREGMHKRHTDRLGGN